MQNGKIIPSEKTDKINDEAVKLCNNRSNLEKGDVLFSGTGTIGKTAVLFEEPTNWNINESVYAIKPNQKYIMPEFLHYILMTGRIREEYMKKISGGTVKSISLKKMRTLLIPLPDLKKQADLIKVIEKFDHLCNDISEGLPAEIAARQKQYEYYRDKLLNFKEK